MRSERSPGRSTAEGTPPAGSGESVEMHVLALEFDLHVPASRSLKEKRAAIRPVLDGIRNRYPVAVAETAHQDTWKRVGLGVAAVSESPGHAESVIDEVERFVWSFPELDVVDATRRWMEMD